MPKISVKHKKFVNEYLSNGGNASKAYLKTVSVKQHPDTAKANASRILQRPEVKEYLDEEQRKLKEKYNITTEFIINEYMDLLESCKDGLDGEGTLPDRATWVKTLHQLTKLLGLDADFKLKQEILSKKKDGDDNDQIQISINI